MPTSGPDVHTIRRSVQRQASRLRLRLFWGFLVLAGLALVLPIGALALVDLYWPLREPAAMWSVCAWGALVAVAFGAGLVLLRRRVPTPRQVALMLESRHPPFMDSLICAIELAERPPEQWNRLDLALLAKVEHDLAAVPVAKLLAPPPRRVAVFTLGAVLALLGIAMLPTTPLWEKAVAHAYERVSGEPTGLLVSPGDTEVGAGDDLLVSARILRGADRASITIIDATGRFDYPMYGAGGAGEHAFEVYGIEEDFRYYVTTPTLRSPPYSVSVFAKPAITDVVIHVEPPAYTGDTPQHYTQWRHVVAPEGSIITVELGTNMAVQAALQVSDADAIAMDAMGPKRQRATFTLTRSFSYRYTLDDTRGHRVAGDREWRFECLPDYAPAIQVLTPDDSATVTETDTVTFSAVATDDYGLELVELVYAVNGGAEERRRLFLVDPNADAPTKEQTVLDQLALTDLVKYGDVITWWIEGQDAALPTPNVGASEPRFIEIRPPMDQPEPQEGDQQNAEGASQLSVSDLIEDQKQLIRSTFGLRRLPSGIERDDATGAVAKGASDLLLAARQRYNDLKEAAGTSNFGAAGQFFEAALEHMAAAEAKLSAGDPEGSLPEQRQALANLIALEVELLKNARMMQQQMAGGGQPQESEQNQQQQDDMQEMAEQKLQAIEEAIERLDTLIQRQENLGDQLEERAAGSEQPQTEDLARRQEQINSDAQAVHDALRKIPEALGADRELARALERMESSQKNLQRQNAGSAAKDGEMSEEFLHRSRDLLGELQQDMSGSKLEAASRLLDAIREGQKEVTEAGKAAAQGADGAPGKDELTRAQQALRESMADLNQKIGQARDSLESQSPGAANTLTEALQAMDNNNVEGKMRRAENALRYGKFDRATPYQEEAQQGMDQLAQALQEAIREGNAPSAEQLAQMLQETLENLAEMKKEMADGSAQGASGELKDAVERDLQKLADRLGDPRMEQLAQRGKQANIGAGGAASDGQMVDVLEQTARLLENRLLESIASERLRLSRLSGRQAPDEYRKLVDEYFKNLSDVAD